MDCSGHRENGQHKPDQYGSLQAQWAAHRQLLKENTTKLMGILAELDKAIHERNLALSEKKAALIERDMALFQRDTAIADRNNALMECDNAIAALKYFRDNSMNCNSTCGCPLRSSSPQSSGSPYSHGRETNSAISESAERESEAQTVLPEKASKPQRRREEEEGGNDGEDLNKLEMNGEWKDVGEPAMKKHRNELEMNGEWKDGEDLDKLEKEGENDGEDLKKTEGLGGQNEVIFDQMTMPSPVCSCTGRVQPCYRWGNCGWQSTCCTTTLSMYPLPVKPNKRRSRVRGRKMSGSVFTKLLGRMAAEGHDLTFPLDLKDHWSKHGTNGHITMR